VYVVLGVVLTGIGVIGIVTPILPTTVFLLVASGLFLKASPRLHRILHTNRITGPYLRAYVDGTGLSVGRKLFTIGLLWVTLAVSAWFVREQLWLLLLLAAVGAGVTIHVATIRARKHRMFGDVRAPAGAAGEPAPGERGAPPRRAGPRE
jgi:hypothetical protein